MTPPPTPTPHSTEPHSCIFTCMVWYWHGDLTRVEKMYEYFRASAVGYFLSDQAKYCFRLCQILSINYKKWTHSFLNIPPSLNGEEVAIMPIQKKKKKILTLNQIFGFLKKPSSVSPFFKRKWLLFWARDHSSITLSRFFYIFRPTHKPYRFTVL